MHRNNGWTVSGAHSRVASAPAMTALHRAAQPEVWDRFSQSASSARAVISASPSSVSTGSSSGSSGWSAKRLLAKARAVFREGVSEARDGRLQVLVDLEYGIEFGHLEELAHLWP